MPLTFVVDEEGWRSYTAEDAWVVLGYVEPGAVDLGATLGILAYRPMDPIDAVVDAITSIEGVSALSDPSSTVVAGFEAMVVDVEGAPDPSFIGYGDFSGPPGSVRFEEGPGYQLFSRGLDHFGIPACHRSRVWIVDVDGTTMTMIAKTVEADDFERLMAVVELLLDGLRFQAGE